ncbi:hypothetical protein [Nocardioides zeae]|uniref:Uncharacterized protein n=1 Tax=Nocardioides zeae TaxID=1457234 RepID=A0A6P0HMW6_9ACTN|nr:hypothetical protein [Nocardioides zeae]NEN80018.1 hypothetical protein [Nocardioides zeae]
MTERPPADETRPYGAAPAPWPPAPAPWPPAPPTVVDPASHQHPYASPPPYPPPYPPPPQPSAGGTADIVASVVLLVVGLLAGIVASATAFVLQVLQIGCEPGDACSEGVQDGVAIAIAGPWLVYLPLGAVAILLMARQRPSWWASTLAVVGASVVWVYGSWVAFDSATW